MKKKSKMMVCAVMFALLSGTTTSFAGEWKADEKGYWYEKDNGRYAASEWIADNGKWYYIGNDGYMIFNGWIGDYYVGADGAMLVNTTTPDGYQVGEDGAWIKENNVQAEYLEKYAEVLRGLTPDSDYERKFQLIYVDEDSVPELFISDIYKTNGKGSVFLYTYDQGNAKKLCDLYVRWHSDNFSYVEKANLVHYYNWENGGKISDAFLSIKNGEVIIQADLFMHEWTDYYMLNGQQVSKSAYENQLNAMKNGYLYKKVNNDTTYEVSEENIQKMLADMNFAM